VNRCVVPEIATVQVCWPLALFEGLTETVPL